MSHPTRTFEHLDFKIFWQCILVQNFWTIYVPFDNILFSIFDVICSNKVSFHRTEDKTRRIMAKQFERKVIEDARKSGIPFPQTSSRPHYHSAFSNWPKLPPIKYRNNENLRQFHSN